MDGVTISRRTFAMMLDVMDRCNISGVELCDHSGVHSVVVNKADELLGVLGALGPRLETRLRPCVAAAAAAGHSLCLQNGRASLGLPHR